MTTATSAFISTVGTNRTVILPESIPIGAQVAVVIMSPTGNTLPDPKRHARFEKVLAAIRLAMAEGYESPKIKDSDLDELIERARHLPRTS